MNNHMFVMSYRTFERLLSDMQISIDATERRKLYKKVLREFGIRESGQDLEDRLKDDFEREEIKRFIKEILRLERVKKKGQGLETYL